MIDTIRKFYRRLNHAKYGYTEVVVINSGKGVIATGFFDNEGDFVKACLKFNGKYNIYAGRNPRPFSFPKFRNCLDYHFKKRAKDEDIKYITAISLDIDPIREKNTSATDNEHEKTINFTLKIQQDINGYVDDSGNGAYLWIPFKDPIKVEALIKGKCKLWQSLIVEKYKPEKFGLRIDGCFDLSRVKKVIGTISMKGKNHRPSRFVSSGILSNEIRDDILRLSVPKKEFHRIPIKTKTELPESFLELVENDFGIRKLWCSPNEDRSAHDWELGLACIEHGIKKTSELAAILVHNPFGKFQRDRRMDYVQTTIKNLLG